RRRGQRDEAAGLERAVERRPRRRQHPDDLDERHRQPRCDAEHDAAGERTAQQMSTFEKAGHAGKLAYGCANVECICGRTVNTGHGALRTTFSATEPSNTCDSPVWPCVPMQMRSTSSVSARLQISTWVAPNVVFQSPSTPASDASAHQRASTV